MSTNTPFKICPQCQTHAALDAQSCANCGRQYRTKFPQAVAPVPKNTPVLKPQDRTIADFSNAPKKINYLPLILGAILLLIIALPATYFFSKSKQSVQQSDDLAEQAWQVAYTKQHAKSTWYIDGHVSQRSDPQSSIQKVSDGKYRVSGWSDYKNVAGTVLKYRWAYTATYQGDSQWTLSNEVLSEY